MIAVISECWANFGFGKAVTQNLNIEVKHIHAEGVTKIGKKLKAFQRRVSDKFILIIDSERNNPAGRWVEGFLKNIESKYGIPSSQTFKAISIKKYKNREKIMIILFEPFIEDAFIRKYDKEIDQKMDKYKHREGKDLIMSLVKDKNPDDIKEIAKNIFQFFS